MTRVALYARYSSDSQSVASIEDQFRICREHAACEKWKIVSTYHDAAIFGASVILRPGVQTLLQDAQRGKFDVVLAEALDRVSRDQADVATLFKHLPLRRRANRHVERRRDHRDSCRLEGHHERALPERPRREDPSRHPGPRREGQVRRRSLLRL